LKVSEISPQRITVYERLPGVGLFLLAERGEGDFPLPTILTGLIALNVFAPCPGEFENIESNMIFLPLLVLNPELVGKPVTDTLLVITNTSSDLLKFTFTFALCFFTSRLTSSILKNNKLFIFRNGYDP
tara:strand:- start:523 stop:909 length:387 start_codon:yes stop_codon:yes gene_type:complete